LGHGDISDETIHFFEDLEISIEGFQTDRLILDIGGGGEGIIGRLMGEQVIAIDPSKRELQEAPPGPLKIVMDARDLHFLDGSFSIATSFFSLMYIPSKDHPKVFEEVYRVMETGGEFWIWDGILPARVNDSKEIVAFRLKISLPDDKIEAGYGTKWPQENQDVEYYLQLAKDTGFELIEDDIQNIVFWLRLKKQ
jgi:SAM-dependent methyltransferase